MNKNTTRGVRVAREYNYYKYFWDTFGIAPHDMDKYDPEWLRIMTVCGSQDNRAQSDRMKSKSNS